MTEVYRRPGSPFWYVTMTVNGKRTRVSTKRTKKAEAERVALQMRKDALDGDQLGMKDTTLRSALFDYYLPSRQKAASYKHLKRHAETLCGDREGIKGLGADTKLHLLTTLDLEAYRSRRQRDGMSEQTIDHELKCVSAAHQLVKSKFRVNPALEFPLARVKGKARYLTEDEEAALLADLDPARPIQIRRTSTHFAPLADTQVQRQANYDLVVMLLDTGCRYGELASLTWAMVDTIDWQWVHIYRPKVDNESRLSLTRRMREVLQRRYESRSGSAYVFPGWHRDADAEDLPRVTTAAIRRAMARVGINSPENVARFGRRDVRSLRDTFATKLRTKGGLSLDQLQKLLGHTDPKMTSKYAHLPVEVASATAVSILDQLTQKGAAH